MRQTQEEKENVEPQCWKWWKKFINKEKWEKNEKKTKKNESKEHEWERLQMRANYKRADDKQQHWMQTTQKKEKCACRSNQMIDRLIDCVSYSSYYFAVQKCKMRRKQ